MPSSPQLLFHGQHPPTGHSSQVISTPSPDTGIFTDSRKDASSPTKKRTQRCKPREEFTTNDLKALLSAVLNVNPWMCARGESKDKWQEVSVLVKQANACEGRSADTLKNKTRGRLDSVAALKKLVKETRESDHEKVKLAAKAQKTAGLNLHNAMMKGHSCQSLKKRTQDDLFSATGHSDIAQEDSSGSGISMLMSRHTLKSKKHHEDTLESIIGLIRTSVDVREVMISEQCKQTEVFILEARAAREEVRVA
ncbi:hypothetical protein BU17DRAFT_98835 [Hysterangium stoloniferum]|nr:hypothetical protein BU17DRAFT_98835 [Hysterangium stoloniferum]